METELHDDVVKVENRQKIVCNSMVGIEGAFNKVKIHIFNTRDAK